MKSVRSVLHINTADNDGGAARSGYRIHAGLKKLGLTSRMFVRSKGTQDPDIQPTAPFPFYYFLDKAFGLLWNQTGLQYFYYPSSRRLLRHPWLKEADVIQLYNIHGNFISPALLPRLSMQKPIIWRLSDMWPFTGHCAYSYGCERWKTGCGLCPILDEYPPLPWDTTAFLWKFKKRAYASSRITVVAPSRWIASLAKESPLLGQFPIHHIPNGIDVSLFEPMDKKEAKRSWGFPEDRHVVLLQDMGPGGERKGRDLLPEFMQAINQAHRNNVSFLVFGAGSLKWKGKPNVVATGMIRREKEMSRLYSAADVFLFPTKAENLANVALESMACGLPLVSFETGGMPDLISSGKNGWLVQNGDIRAAADAAANLLADSSIQRGLSRAARETILRDFTQEKEAKEILAVYEQAVQRYAAPLV